MGHIAHQRKRIQTSKLICTCKGIRPEFFYFLYNGNFFEKIESGGRNKKKKASKVTSRVNNKNKIEKRVYFFF